MNNIIYLIGLVVVVVAILGFFGCVGLDCEEPYSDCDDGCSQAVCGFCEQSIAECEDLIPNKIPAHIHSQCKNYQRRVIGKACRENKDSVCQAPANGSLTAG